MYILDSKKKKTKRSSPSLSRFSLKRLSPLYSTRVPVSLSPLNISSSPTSRRKSLENLSNAISPLTHNRQQSLSPLSIQKTLTSHSLNPFSLSLSERRHSLSPHPSSPRSQKSLITFLFNPSSVSHYLTPFQKNPTLTLTENPPSPYTVKSDFNITKPPCETIKTLTPPSLSSSSQNPSATKPSSTAHFHITTHQQHFDELPVPDLLLKLVGTTLFFVSVTIVVHLLAKMHWIQKLELLRRLRL